MKNKTREKPKPFIIKITPRPHGNADKRVVSSIDSKGKRSWREEKIDPPQVSVGYYSDDHAWQMVSKEKATRLSHKDANQTIGRLKRLGYVAIMENLAD